MLATALAVGTALAGTGALAPAKGYTVGDPQPELAPFSLGAAGGGTGSGAVLPDGTLVLASLSATGTSAVVCTLHPGGRQCASTATLGAYTRRGAQDDFTGVPEVLATGGTDVSVVVEDCCSIPVFSGVGGAVVFDSTDDGRTFSSEIPAGVIQGVGAATFADDQLVVASSETTALNVQALPPPPYVALTTPANPNNRYDGDTSLTTYKGGVLVASDDARGDTLVEYAPSGSNFNLSSSYGSPVGIFDGEDLAGVSGKALLTHSSTSTPGAFLRFFNGKSFGPRYQVPEPAGAVAAHWSVQEAGGLVHVFFLDRSDASDICSETTYNGVQWSQLLIDNSATTAGALVPVLGPSGAGLVYETDVDAPPLLAQPVLDYQSVVVRLARLRAPAGKRTTLTGQVVPRLGGQVVRLERRISIGHWSDISALHESAAGRFSFTVPGRTDSYRAVVACEPGYYLYGYSNVVTLTAVPKRKS